MVAAGQEDVDDEYKQSALMEAGRYTLQQAALIIGQLWFVGDMGVRRRILLLLHQQVSSDIYTVHIMQMLGKKQKGHILAPPPSASPPAGKDILLVRCSTMENPFPGAICPALQTDCFHALYDQSMRKYMKVPHPPSPASAGMQGS